MNTKDMLKRLSQAVGTPGMECQCETEGVENVGEVALQMLREYIPDAKTDRFGNVYGVIKKSEQYPTILLDAHIDEIGLVVSYIEDDGFLRVGFCGGIDRRVLPAQSVTVYGKKAIKGIISTLPPHVAKDGDKAIKKEEVAIDIGLSKEQAEQVVSLGDRVTLNVQFAELMNGLVTGKALDDRAGVVSILYALELLRDKDVKFNIAVLFSAQEEVGCRGAKVGAYRLDPDYSIAVDVSFATCPDLTEKEAGKLGGGPMIGISPYLDRKMFQQLKAVAEKEGIEYQVEVMDGATGTNADNIIVTRGGVTGGLLSIPQRNMHTSVEVVDIADVEQTGRLMAAFIEKAVL